MAYRLTKLELTKLIKNWLEEFLVKKYGNEYTIYVGVPERALNLLNNKDLKKIKNISFFNFKPDLIGVLKHKTNNSIELVIINRELKSIGLRELGELQCYCRLSNPLLAMWISLQGLAGPIDKLINHNKKQGILEYDKKKIIILRWDSFKKEIDKYSISPVEYREFILS